MVWALWMACTRYECTSSDQCMSLFGSGYSCDLERASCVEEDAVSAGETDAEGDLVAPGGDARVGELWITEVMVNPAQGSSKWFEIYNASERAIGLRGLLVGTLNEKTNASQFVLENPVDLLPGEFYVVTDEQGIAFADGFREIGHEAWPDTFSFSRSLFIQSGAGLVSTLSWVDSPWLTTQHSCTGTDVPPPGSWYLADLNLEEPEEVTDLREWLQTSPDGPKYDSAGCNRGSPGFER